MEKTNIKRPRQPKSPEFVATVTGKDADGVEWRSIPGYEGLYIVSDDGRVRNLEGLTLRPATKPNGYLFLSLSRRVNNKREKTWHHVHRLVAAAFLPNPENKTDVDHIDGDKTNNKVSNLRWATRFENTHNEATYPKLLAHIAEVNSNPESRAKSNAWLKDPTNYAIRSAGQDFKKRRTKCIETGEIFESLTAAAKSFGVSESCIQKSCERHLKGMRSKPVGKNSKLVYHFEYIIGD